MALFFLAVDFEPDAALFVGLFCAEDLEEVFVVVRFRVTELDRFRVDVRDFFVTV